jgi:glutamate-1-semialdehyde 2,1-aminomutase
VIAERDARAAVAEDYAARFRGSREKHQNAAALAGEAAHDSWRFEPFPVYFDCAAGPRKWDLDGNVYVDFWMGHGALLFGHRFPPVEAAVAAQLARGTHLGGAHSLQVDWAEQIRSLIPSAERVRFTSSGSEATLLALRVARSFTAAQASSG